MAKHIHVHVGGKTKDGSVGLWKYNTTTGLWRLERTCEEGTAAQWLNIFKKDEPNSFFKLSKVKPTGKP